MASNKLRANATKTTLMFMNLRGEQDVKINVGEAGISLNMGTKCRISHIGCVCQYQSMEYSNQISAKDQAN